MKTMISEKALKRSFALLIMLFSYFGSWSTVFGQDTEKKALDYSVYESWNRISLEGNF